MKIALLVVFIFTTAYANSDECIGHQVPTELEQISRSLGRVNCHTSVNFMMDSSLSSNQETVTCGSCQNLFISPLNGQHEADHDQLRKSERKVFTKALFNELQKSIAITTAEVLALNSSSSSFPQSVSSCSTNEFYNNVKKCSAVKESGITIEAFSSSIATSIANTLKPVTPAACPLIQNISQSQLNGLSLEAAGHILSDDLISSVLLLQDDNFAANLDGLRPQQNNDPTVAQTFQEFQILLSRDPVFKALKNNPREFKSFFSSLRNLSAEDRIRRIEDFKNSDVVGNLLDSMFKKQCEDAYKSFAETVCAPDYQSNKIDLGSISNYSKVSFEEFDDDPEYATDPKVEEKNFELLSFCSSSDTPTSKYKLENKIQSMNRWMPEDKRVLNIKNFNDLNDNEKRSFNQQVCDANCSAAPNSSYCFIKTQLINQTAQGNTLAQTQYSGGALDLIRSITGTPSKISKEDKEVLISYGILPQDDGSYITPSPTAPTEIASASPASGNAGATTNRTQNPNGRSTNSAQFAESQQGSQSSRRQQQSGTSAGPYSPIMSPEFSSAFEEQLNDLSDLTNQERQRFNQFQEEMARRLSRSNSSAPSRTEVERVAQAVARERGANLSPQRRQQFVSSYVDAYDQVQNSFNTAPGFANAGGVELPPSSGPSQSEANMQNALEKMALTQQARASGGTGSISGGGNSDATAGRSPANTADTDSSSLSVRIRLDDLQADPQQALAGLPATLPDSFILEIEKNSQVYRYEVLKNGSSFRVSQLNGGSEGRVLIARLEKLLKDRAPESIPEQQAALPILQDMFSRAN